MIRITGMNSGLDTEAIITELASARSIKVQNIEKDRTKLSWKVDAWKELNKKIYSLYSEVVSDMRFDYAYAKKTTKVSDPNAVTVMTAGDAMNGVQSLKINKLSKTAYLTGASVDASSSEKLLANMEGLDWLSDESKGVTFKVKVGSEEKQIRITGYDTLKSVADKFKEVGLDAKFDEKTKRFFIASKTQGAAGNFEISPIISGLPKELAEGLKEVPKAWSDLTEGERQGKIESDYTSARDSIIAANNEVIKKFNAEGSSNQSYGLKEVPDEADWALANLDKTPADYEKVVKDIIEANNKIIANEDAAKKEYTDVMKALGLLTKEAAQSYGADTTSGQYATKITGEDAEIELNGATFTSATNTFEINGLTMTVQKETGDTPITLTTEQDTSGIYDVIKNFITKYSELINEMDKLYNAASASKYQPLTKEEKDAMSETEVEEWEKKIKESLLRRDTTLSSVSSALKKVMLETHLPGKIGRNDAQDIYLSYFGIETLGYFKAKDNEKNAYHINGNPDDVDTKGFEDKLKKAIATEPDTVIEFFQTLSKNLYTTLEDKMSRTEYSSSFTVYNDKQMDIELKSYDSKIIAEQKKLNDYIDGWYKKFSQMEVALSKMNSAQSSVSGLFG